MRGELSAILDRLDIADSLKTRGGRIGRVRAVRLPEA